MRETGLTIRILLFFLLIGNGGLLLSQDLGVPAHFSAYAKNYPEHVLYQGPEDNRFIALTFDDGPTEITASIFDLLEKHQVKATFFWQGKNLIERPEVVRRAINSGHEFGNHSWDHPNCIDMNPKELWNEQLQPTNSIYDSLFGQDVKLYRPPYGAVSESQLDYIREKDIITVLWSLSTLDWDVERNSANEIFERFQSAVYPGAIVLLHDMDFGNTAAEKLEGLERIIFYGRAEGYSFLTIPELLNKN